MKSIFYALLLTGLVQFATALSSERPAAMASFFFLPFTSYTLKLGSALAADSRRLEGGRVRGNKSSRMAQRAGVGTSRDNAAVVGERQDKGVRKRPAY
jgi:hypothetical protein